MALWCCKRCQKNSLEFDDTDPDFEKRKKRHEEGRHTEHKTISERDGHNIHGHGMGNLDIGPVEWEKVKE